MRRSRDWTSQLAWLKETTDTHDLGFIFYLSHVLGYRVTGDETLLPDALAAAETFTRRYNPRGEYMQAWGRIDASLRSIYRMTFLTYYFLNSDIRFCVTEFPFK